MDRAGSFGIPVNALMQAWFQKNQGTPSPFTQVEVVASDRAHAQLIAWGTVPRDGLKLVTCSDGEIEHGAYLDSYEWLLRRQHACQPYLTLLAFGNKLRVEIRRSGLSKLDESVSRADGVGSRNQFTPWSTKRMR